MTRPVILTLTILGAISLSYLAAIWLPGLRPFYFLITLGLLGVWSAAGITRWLPSCERRHQRIVMGWLALWVLVAPFITWGAGLLVAALALGLTTLVMLGASMWSLRRWRPELAERLRPATTHRLTCDAQAAILAGILVVAISAALAPPATPAAPRTPTAELAYLAKMDQEDRSSGRILLLPQRDQQRLQRVLALEAAGQVLSPLDQYRAALVLQHGRLPEHYARAYHYASQAAGGGLEEAEWLAQAALQRWRAASGAAPPATP